MRMTPTAQSAYVQIMTYILQHGPSVEEAWKYGAKAFSRWLSEHENAPRTVSPDEMALALPVHDNTMPVKVLIGLLVSAAILDEMRKGETTEKAVRRGFQRFSVHAPERFLSEQIAKFAAERERLLALKPHQMDDGAGGTIDLIQVPKGVDPGNTRQVEAHGRLVDKKSLQRPS